MTCIIVSAHAIAAHVSTYIVCTVTYVLSLLQFPPVPRMDVEVYHIYAHSCLSLVGKPHHRMLCLTRCSFNVVPYPTVTIGRNNTTTLISRPCSQQQLV